MPLESYRHRFNDEFKLSDLWYLDDHEVDNFCTMLDRGEVSYNTLERACEALDFKLNIANFRPKENRTSQDQDLFLNLEETIERLKPYRKKLKQLRDSGEIDIGDSVN